MQNGDKICPFIGNHCINRYQNENLNVYVFILFSQYIQWDLYQRENLNCVKKNKKNNRQVLSINAEYRILFNWVSITDFEYYAYIILCRQVSNNRLEYEHPQAESKY